MKNTATTKKPQDDLTPPAYCSYASGPCDQDFDQISNTRAFFIYPNDPSHLASTLKETVRQLGTYSNPSQWKSWEDLNVGGKIIFCEICKAIRASNLIVANITNLNFNVLFEIGYAIGLQKPILPVRDNSYDEGLELIREIGIFDTLGYEPFQNSQDLQSLVTQKTEHTTPISTIPKFNNDQPIYLIKSPIDSDGNIRLLSDLRKGYWRFRTFDSRESSRLSLHEAVLQVFSSASVVAHLIDPNRKEARIHNARAAFVCGMALAANKRVLMLQEGFNEQPIDYKDLVISYQEPSDISFHVERFLRSTADAISDAHNTLPKGPEKLLERINLGDVAAENEIQALGSYFVVTKAFQQARQGHARIVVGRKGSGKTALFYGIRDWLQIRNKKHLILDLKPEGHQFTKLRELVLSNLSEGMQLHTLTAFWHYLLLVELLGKLIERIGKTAFQTQESLDEFNSLKDLLHRHTPEEADFSERLMSLVDRLITTVEKNGTENLSESELTSIIYTADIGMLNQAILENVNELSGISILFDNIDKGFPTHGIDDGDVIIIRCLLDATRKIQRTLEKKKIECTTTIFLRRDVYAHLVDKTPDRGKETAVNIDWSDIELVKELLLRRLQFEAPELNDNFDTVWGTIFDTHVQGESSFRYIVNRTFLRPRDILNLVRKCIQVAVSRNHDRVEQDDILEAERDFSEDMFNELGYEIRDVFPKYQNLLLGFLGQSKILSEEDLQLILLEAEIDENQINEAIEHLLWFGLIGLIVGTDEERFAYQLQYNVPKLQERARRSGTTRYVIHPAFMKAIS